MCRFRPAPETQPKGAPRYHVIRLVMSKNGTFDWQKFRRNHSAYCKHYAEHGWDFCTLTLLGWIDAGMPPPPPVAMDKNQKRRDEANQIAKLLRTVK